MKVSVIIPAYNHEKYIADAIDSVLSQSCQDFEIIIINDGSTDSTEQRILTFQDHRIRYLNQNNSGAHFTLNKGISLAQGEFISILNSDDVYLPERLEKCLDFLETNTNYSVVMTTVEGIDEQGKPAKLNMTPQIKAWLDWYASALPLFIEDRFYPNAFAKNIMITTSNLFARRRVFEECGGFKGLRYAHDWDMLLRLSRRYHIHLIKKDLLQYRMHAANTVHERGGDLKVQYEVNWLIVENLRELNANVPFSELLGLLKNNKYLSFEMIFFLLMKDQPAFYDLIDFKNPQAMQLMQLLQFGLGITTAFELQTKIKDLQAGSAWLAEQRELWEKIAAEREKSILALQAHTQDLQASNEWLTRERDSWEKVAAEREKGIVTLQAQAQELQTGNEWLSSQRDAWEKVAAEREKCITALNSRLLEREDTLNKIRNHWGMRLINLLSKSKLF